MFWILGDLASTKLALDVGGFEVNPLGRVLLETYGIRGALLLKVGTTVLLGCHWWLCLRVLTWKTTGGVMNESGIVRLFRFGHPVALLLLGVVLTLNNLLAYWTLLQH